MKRRRLSVSNGQLWAGACEKIPRAFAHRVPLFILIIVTSLVCVCIDVRPSHTTHAQPISAVRVAVNVPIYALHPLLPASKTVLNSWSLVVICPLIARGEYKSELEFQAGTSS